MDVNKDKNFNLTNSTLRDEYTYDKLLVVIFSQELLM